MGQHGLGRRQTGTCTSVETKTCSRRSQGRATEARHEQEIVRSTWPTLAWEADPFYAQTSRQASKPRPRRITSLLLDRPAAGFQGARPSVSRAPRASHLYDEKTIVPLHASSPINWTACVRFPSRQSLDVARCFFFLSTGDDTADSLSDQVDC